jgi:hypothetical protein
MQLRIADFGRQNDWHWCSKKETSSTCGYCLDERDASAQLAARRSTYASSEAQETQSGLWRSVSKRKHEGSMIGLGKRPKSKLPEPSKNTKNTGKQDYMAEVMNANNGKGVY